MGYYSALKKKKILPFTNTWMSLEDITLSAISEIQEYKYHTMSLTRGIKKSGIHSNRVDRL